MAKGEDAKGPRGTLRVPGSEAADARIVTPSNARTMTPADARALTPVARTLMPALLSGIDADETGGPAARHDLVKQIGQGGMGQIYIALDPELRRRVAFKRLLPELRHDARMTARFVSEVQVTAQLDHPNIVPINGMALAADGTRGFTMKLVDGKDLRKQIDEWRAGTAHTGLAARLDVFLRICEAMAYAHDKGVLHRDLKPENVMVGRTGEVYVMDWGIFRLIGAADDDARATIDADAEQAAGHGQTLDGSVLGTPQYMSPEQAWGKIRELDARSDVYALGLILQELVTLVPARTGDELALLLDQARRGVRARPVDVVRELRGVIAKATALEPVARYPTTRALAEDVRRFLRGEAPAASPDGPLQAAARLVGRYRVASLATIFVLFAAGVAVAAYQKDRRDRAAAASRRHEAAIQHFASLASTYTHHLDDRLYRVETALWTLAGRATEVARGSDAREAERPYFAADYEAGGDGPPDLGPVPRYRRPVSWLHAVVKLPPDADAAALLRDARRMAGLVDGLRDALLATESPDARGLPGDGPRQLAFETGVPALRAFVTLENGVHVSFPGQGGYDVAYDGRTRPKYALATEGDHYDVQWGKLFVDRNQEGLVFPAAVALLAEDGTLLGAAGIELRYAWLEQHMCMDEPWVLACYLVRDGRVHAAAGPAVDPRARVEAPPGLKEGEVVPLPEFPDAAVNQAIAEGRIGVVPLGDGRLAAVYPIESERMSFVVVADEERLLASRR